MTTSTFLGTDKLPIHYYQWMPDKEIKGIVQIAHGLAEHAQRYAYFAQLLTKAGYAVYANDHRGHGQTAGSAARVGYFEDAPFWEAALNDMHALQGIIQQNHPDKPIYLFGHSMGSMLSRQYITKWGTSLNGVIVCATGSDPGLLGKIGGIVAKLTANISGSKERSNFLNTLSFGKFNDAFKPNRTDFDWLSRDKEEVDKYIADAYCGAVFTAGFWVEFLKGINQINHSDTYKNTPKDLPILLIAGDKDPVGDMGKGVNQVYQHYQQAGINNVQCILYPEARHELLHEVNKEVVIGDVLEWLQSI